MFVKVGVMQVYYFIEATNNALFCGSPIGLEVDVVRFSLVVGFVFIEVKKIVITACAEVFGMEGYFSFASFASSDFWLPFEFFITSIAEVFGMVFFLLIAIGTFFYHLRIMRSHIKNFVQTCYFCSLFDGRTSYNLYYANFW